MTFEAFMEKHRGELEKLFKVKPEGKQRKTRVNTYAEREGLGYLRFSERYGGGGYDDEYYGDGGDSSHVLSWSSFDGGESGELHVYLADFPGCCAHGVVHGLNGLIGHGVPVKGQEIFLQGIEEQAKECGYEVLFASTNQKQKAIGEFLVSQGFKEVNEVKRKDQYHKGHVVTTYVKNIRERK